LESIKKIVQYITDKTTFISISQQLLNLDNQVLDGNFYHDRTLTIYSGNTLELADGRILFVNGDLIMKANSNLIGNVVVFGSVIFEGSSSTQSTFLGTLYIGNHFTSNTKLIAGQSDRPSFIFSTLHNNINQKIEGYVFITGSKFTYDVKDVTSTIHGGVYVDDNDYKVLRGVLNIIPTDITLFYDLFETYALPYDSSLVSDGSYTYTSPR
ncbi:MAG: hypothetical protein RBT45_04545, partial [Acholeplasmataceae bacterium]|nr:hypothetical protein [Acholeplasmataceae bacterium]